MLLTKESGCRTVTWEPIWIRRDPFSPCLSVATVFIRGYIAVSAFICVHLRPSFYALTYSPSPPRGALLPGSSFHGNSSTDNDRLAQPPAERIDRTDRLTRGRALSRAGPADAARAHRESPDRQSGPGAPAPESTGRVASERPLCSQARGSTAGHHRWRSGRAWRRRGS